MITKQTDQVTQALGLLLVQFKGLPDFEGLITSWINQVQILENVFFDLLNLRAILTATGAQLDALGRILSCGRDGRSDDDYRTRLQAQVLINKTTGTIPQVTAIVTALLADTYFFTVSTTNANAAPGTYHGPSDVYVDVARDIGDTPTPIAVAKLLRKFVAGGVRAVIAWDDSSFAVGGAAFSLGPDPDADGNSVGLGDAAGATGGMFIRASDGETPQSME